MKSGGETGGGNGPKGGKTVQGPEDRGQGEDNLTLGSALKLAGIAATGGQAKALIQEGAVKVNGEVERRRKRRVVQGDEIEVAGETFVIELQEEQ